MEKDHQSLSLIEPLRRAFASADPNAIRGALIEAFEPDAQIRLGHPFQEVDGPGDLWERIYPPLLQAIPDLERRDWIAMSGPRWGAGNRGDWVGLGGNMVGTMTGDWLGIPATDAPVFMRYQEYLRIEDGQIVEMEGLWDIPELMIQSGIWPMAPQLGVEWMCPGPATGQGSPPLRRSPRHICRSKGRS